MKENVLSFFITGVCVGSVNDVTEHNGFFRGRLVLNESSGDIALSLRTVRALAKQVDAVPPDEYLTAWEDWRRGCNDIQRLISIGDTESPVESFSIESNWLIEWGK